jgi:hypothetical protein
MDKALDKAAIGIDATCHVIYLFGGQSTPSSTRAGVPLANIHTYDPITRVWCMLPSRLHRGRVNGVACYIPRFQGFFVAGGIMGGVHKKSASAIEFYSTKTHTSIWIPPKRWCLPLDWFPTSLHLI